ncbi:unnamed protein product [Phytophthora fragariaefolia]|uniref:Unnamed protein product n=1 Tax=Phytophthora fragariaefolia TaxID=1490495 RepID=A0A9W6YDG8_9STRA|nr:unnamed protein product [Phytophthora fragariaefolia]
MRPQRQDHYVRGGCISAKVPLTLNSFKNLMAERGYYGDISSLKTVRLCPYIGITSGEVHYISDEQATVTILPPEQIDCVLPTSVIRACETRVRDLCQQQPGVQNEEVVVDIKGFGLITATTLEIMMR